MFALLINDPGCIDNSPLVRREGRGGEGREGMAEVGRGAEWQKEKTKEWCGGEEEGEDGEAKTKQASKTTRT